MRKIKKTVTLWDLVIWAYRDQKVGYLSRSDVRMGYGRTATDRVCQRLQVGTRIDGCGPFGASLAVHPDADTVHQVVCASLSSRHQAVLTGYAERGSAPSLDIIYQPARMVPVLRTDGRPQMIYDDNRNICACEIKKIGLTRDELHHLTDKKRREYRLFVDLLEVIFEGLSTCALEGRRVQGLGVVREPWAAAVRSRRPRLKIAV